MSQYRRGLLRALRARRSRCRRCCRRPARAGPRRARDRATSAGIGSGRNARTIRRRRRTSAKSITTARELRVDRGAMAPRSHQHSLRRSGQPSLARYSAIAQPKAMRESPCLASTSSNWAATSARDRLGLQALVVEHARERAVTLGDEAAVVVAAVLDAEPLGQPATPGPLLARGLVVGAGDDVVERLERLEAAGVEEAGADQDVLVGEGEHGPPVLVVHHPLEHRVALAGALHRGEPDQHARRAPDALEGAEREALQLAAVPCQRDQDPHLGLLRQESGLEPARALGADVGHLGQLCVGELRAILGLDLDRHARAMPPEFVWWSLLVQRESGPTRNSAGRERPAQRISCGFRTRERRDRAAPAARRRSRRRGPRRTGRAGAAPGGRRGGGTPATRPDAR